MKSVGVNIVAVAAALIVVVVGLAAWRVEVATLELLCTVGGTTVTATEVAVTLIVVARSVIS